MKLTKRSYQPEIMDDLDISGDVIGKTLKELDTINRFLGGNAISLRALKKILKEHKIESVADLGCGGADILKEMVGLGKRFGYDLAAHGIDANPHIVAYAKENTIDYPTIHIRCENVWEDEFSEAEFDVIHCCLFLHHFTEEDLIKLIRLFKSQAKTAIIINDLHRHTLAYYSIKWITKFFSRSYMVKNDAAISVARGFKRSELKSLLDKAGIQKYSLRWRWAFRWELIIKT